MTNWRNILAGVRGFVRDVATAHAESLGRGPTPWRLAKWTVTVLVVLALLYYPVGMAMISRINADPDFGPGEVKPNQSHAVAMVAALIDREVNQTRWTPNDPFFLPGAALDNMPNYQTGIFAALSRFTVELSDQLGRARGASAIDPDLDKAVGLLKYPGNVWVFNLTTSLMPTATSESQYNAARKALLNYNQRLADGSAVFDRRADNLIATLERIANDLGSASGILEDHIRVNKVMILDRTSDDVFYRVKGRLYAYALLLRELGIDYESLIREKELTKVWAAMLETFRTGAALAPLVVANCAPDAQLCPNHLAAEGFYVVQARTRLFEVINVLMK